MIWILACVHPVAPSWRPEDGAAFARAVAARAGDGARARGEGLLLRTADGREALLFLEDLRGDCARAPTACQDAVDDFLREARAALLPEAPPGPERLVEALRTEAWVQAAIASGTVPAASPFAGDLYRVLLFDWPERSRACSLADLDRLGRPLADLRPEIAANTRARLGGSEALLRPVAPGEVAALQLGNYHQASLLLDEAAWAALAPTAEGRLLAAAPAYDLLLYAWVRDDTDRERVRALVAEAWAAAEHPLSPTLLRWDGAWVAD